MNREDFTILVSDDDQRIREMLVLYLKGHGFTVMAAEDGEQALELYYSNSNKIDLILLDVMMPKKDGFEVLEELRGSSLVPVIMVTAREAEYDQIKGLKCGADDYISKPFSPTVLLARIESVLRRCSPKAQMKVLLSGLIELDLRGKIVRVKDEAIKLTQKEFDLLTYLMSNPGEVLSRDAILNAIWSYDYDGDPRTVDTHIKQVRHKLKECGSYIRTIHGMGYLFEGKTE